MNHLWSSLGLLVTLGIAFDGANLAARALESQAGGVQSRLLDRCCQVGREKAIESAKFNCKMSARDALFGSSDSASSRNGTALLATSADTLLNRDPNFADQCEMFLESCCLAFHRTKNCDSGKQFAKSGTSCMDVELSKEATVATESFNDCCMSCSLGILAARNPVQNDRLRTGGDRCKLISPLASSLSGQLYEQTYTECCQENLPRPSSALHEPGAPIDCSQANACSHRCLASGSPDPITGRPLEQDRCHCYTGYKLAQDEVTCVDIDECKLNLHTCNRQSEICDNTRGSFRCLARSIQSHQQHQSRPATHHHYHFSNSQHSHHHQQQHQTTHQVRPPTSGDSFDQTLGAAEPIERPFSSLRLRPPSTARW